MNEHDFSRLPPAAQAYIRDLEARAAFAETHARKKGDKKRRKIDIMDKALPAASSIASAR